MDGTDGFGYSFKDFIAFFVEFENTIRQIAPPGVLETIPRDPFEMLRVFHLHSGCEFSAVELDFSRGLRNISNSQSSGVWSFVLNYEKIAFIIVNDEKKEDGSPLLNHCNRRFFLVKEAIHVILRDKFNSREREDFAINEQDTETHVKLAKLFDEILFRPFSIYDFDNQNYSLALKIENFAELFALFLLYPLEDIAKDRKKFLDNLYYSKIGQQGIISASTMPFATKYLVPDRYVHLIFRWNIFDEMFDLYKQNKIDSNIESSNLMNQTKLDWLPTINNKSRSIMYADVERGTGVIVRRVLGSYQFSHSSGIEYRAFQKFVTGKRDVVVYQWIPHSIAHESAVLAADCGDDLPCLRYCVIPGCVCLDGFCRRR